MKIDRERALGELGIPSQMYDELLQIFKVQTESTLQELEGVVASSNHTEIAKLAHSIKGSAGNLRLDELQELARKIEFAAKGNADMAGISSDFTNLKALFADFKVLVPLS